MSIFGWSYPPGCSGPPEDIELPETCPVCAADNANDETGDWAYEAGPYCSDACKAKDAIRLREEAEAEAAMDAKIEADELAWSRQEIRAYLTNLDREDSADE